MGANPKALHTLDSYKRSLVNSLTSNLQRFGFEKVARIESLEQITDTKKESPAKKAGPRSSNLRVKLDKDKFLKEAFDYVANHFEGTLEELKGRNQEIETDFTRIDARRFSAAIYQNGKAASRCTVTLNQGERSFQGITILLGEHWSEGSYNEILMTSEDGYSLFLRSSGMRSGAEQQLTCQGAAEFLWGFFIEPFSG